MTGESGNGQGKLFDKHKQAWWSQSAFIISFEAKTSPHKYVEPGQICHFSKKSHGSPHVT